MRKTLTSAIAVAFVSLYASLGTANAAISVDIGSAQGAAGDTVEFTVSLAGSTAAEQVVAVNQRIDFAVATPILAKTDGTPDCEALSGLSQLELTTFDYKPTGCVAGTNCTGMLLNAVSFKPVTPIVPNGPLYKCKFRIPAEAPPGTTYAMTNALAVVTLASLDEIDVTAQSQSGTITVAGGGATPTPTTSGVVETPTPTTSGVVETPTPTTSVVVETPTPTTSVVVQTPTPTPTTPAEETVTPTSGPTVLSVNIESVEGEPGEDVDFVVNLAGSNAEQQVVAINQRVDFATPAPIKAKTDGTPDCEALSGLSELELTTFDYQPPGCVAGTNCTGMLLNAVSFKPVTPIVPNGPLYKCKFHIPAAAARGTRYDMHNALAVVTLASLDEVDVTDQSQSGQIVVAGGPTPTPTTPGLATATPTLTPTTQVPVNTVTPTAPATATATRTASSGPTKTATASPTVVPGESTLAEAITALQTVIPVTNAAGFPRSGLIQIGQEQIRYNGISTTGDPPISELLNAERGVNGTLAAAHGEGVAVRLLGPSKEDNDGCDCRVGTSGNSGRTAWLVLVPAIGLLARRRVRGKREP